MSRFPFTILGAIVCIQCGSGEPASKEVTVPFLGRWDVTASQGDAEYPLWFELEQFEDGLKGRFQPSGGHSRPMEGVSVAGSRIQFSCCGFELEGHASSEGIEGTGKAQGEAFSWKAQAAPELPARPDLGWGDPVDLLTGGMEGGRRTSGKRPPGHLRTVYWSTPVVEPTIYTTDLFKDFKLHIEVNCPQGSNSGIYLRGRYEIQIQDDYGKPVHSRNMGGIYGYITPSRNAARPAGAWQEMDVTLNGRWVTVVLNGETVIEHQGDSRDHGGSTRFQRVGARSHLPAGRPRCRLLPEHRRDTGPGIEV